MVFIPLQKTNQRKKTSPNGLYKASKDQPKEKNESQWSLYRLKRPIRGKKRVPMVFITLQKTNQRKKSIHNGLYTASKDQHLHN